ncbi:hypothetical protein [Nereida sp. NH-UV-3]|uniref:hypothetical protein n=1 Tax=Nereida TaxID=282198 RepID=UPI0036F28121
MKLKALISSALGCILLAGCEGETDPSKANIFDNLRNIETGEYDRQISTNDAEVERIIASNNAAQRNINSLETQEASNSREIGLLRSEIASLKTRLSALRSSSAGQANGLHVSALEDQVTAVEADFNAGANPKTLRSELRNISAAISALSS